MFDKYKNINCYDSKENIIESTDFDLFNKISQQVSDLKKKNEFNNIDYYKKIFDSYYKQTFENEGQEISFNLLVYSGQDPKTFEYHDTQKRFKIINKLSLFIESEEKVLAITGVSGIGKTITLLHFLNYYIQKIQIVILI